VQAQHEAHAKSASSAMTRTAELLQATYNKQLSELRDQLLLQSQQQEQSEKQKHDDFQKQLKEEQARHYRGVESTLSQERHAHSLDVTKLESQVLTLKSKCDHGTQTLADKERRWANTESASVEQLQRKDSSMKKLETEIESLRSAKGLYISDLKYYD
jgi:hypothetical protein